MSRFATPSPTPQTAASPTRSGKLISLLLILEALRQQPVPMQQQKV